MGKKNKQKLSNALRLNFYDLKTIHFFHPCYHQKIIGDIFKNVQKTSVSHISPYSVQNAGKYRPEKTPYWDIFHTVCFNEIIMISFDEN